MNEKDLELKEKEKEKDKEKELYTEAVNKLNSYGLEWTFRSINYILNKENVSFGQLRSCVYIREGNGVFDYIKSTILLIKAGLVGSKQFKETDSQALDERAYEIIEEWREEFGYIGTLHLLIISVMETKHFFMGTQDLAVINHLSSKNLQKDLAQNLIKEDLEEKVRQAQALSTTI